MSGPRSNGAVAGLNQKRLGQAIGVTFQQVQKYENGTNRVAASTLCRVAEALTCDVADFFANPDLTKPDRGDASIGLVVEAMAGLAIRDRKRLVSFAQAMVAKRRPRRGGLDPAF